MDKIIISTFYSFITTILLLFSALAFSESIDSTGTASATVIKYASGETLTWKDGQYVDIFTDISPVKIVRKRVKMSKNLGVIEGVAKGPIIPNTQITWAAFSVEGSYICGVEKDRSLVVCGKIESTTKVETLAFIKTNSKSPEFINALVYVQKYLGIKELNDAITGLKVGDRYRGFADGSALVEIDAWRKSRGYFNSDETAAMYKGYDEATFMNLIKAGDIRATQFVAFKTKSPGKSQELYNMAAAYGSTAALINLAHSRHSIGTFKEKEISKKSFILNALTYYEVARLRGDPHGDVIGRQSTFIGHMDFELTPEDANAVQVEAKSIYDKLQQQRYQLGLGDFDNSSPVSVTTYYEMRKNDIEG